MNMDQQESDGATRVAYILGVPLAEKVVRQWPQMGEIVRTSRLVADVEGNFPELTLEVGRRLQLDDVVVVEWTCNYGDGRLYRNVTIVSILSAWSKSQIGHHFRFFIGVFENSLHHTQLKHIHTTVETASNTGLSHVVA